ncbi:MAG: methylated-DNA--[protein]-cysteine S-methyltransferase [Chloroflexi bacterium]|nr:methylated-DNA--[protein]-cysteine S-methyltransferase [Chloroflexota bacterium]
MTGDNLRYFIFNISAGWMGVLSSAKGLVRATFPRPSAEEARCLLEIDVDNTEFSPHHFEYLAERLRAFFSGSKVAFPDALDLSVATPFQRRVWETTRLIPYGETLSYRQVAERIENPRASRAVGQALGRNPLPIIVPCHRVLASNGGLCGFGGGLDMKQYLLTLESQIVY